MGLRSVAAGQPLAALLVAFAVSAPQPLQAQAKDPILQWNNLIGYGPPVTTMGQVLRRQRESRLAVRADPDASGQSLTGESITNPATCHGVVLDSGNKVHVETDFADSGEMPLTLTRGYNKAIGSSFIFGDSWSSSFDYWVAETGQNCPEPEEPTSQPTPEWCLTGKLLLTRPGGIRFKLDKDAEGVYRRNLYWALELKNAQGERTGWEVHSEDDHIEHYDSTGHPISIRNKHGIGWTYRWKQNYLVSQSLIIDRIEHTSGRYVQFNYVNKSHGETYIKQLSSIQDPNLGLHSYSFVNDSIYEGAGSRVSGVAAPNGNTRTYHYELAGSLRHALTGISINGARYSTYSYYPDTGELGPYVYEPNAQGTDPRASEWQDGRIKETRLSGDAEKMTFSYARQPGGIQTTTVTNALGASWTYTYTPYGIGKQFTSVAGAAGPNSCPNTPKDIGYTDNNPSSLTDWSGNEVRRRYNAKRQLVREITGTGVEARTKVIKWKDDDYNNAIEREELHNIDSGLDAELTPATMVAETVYKYYEATRPEKYRLETVTRRDTATGESRVTEYRYTLHNNGIVSSMTIDGPLTDVNDVTTSTYNVQGELIGVTNALGHQTTYSRSYSLPYGSGWTTQTTDPNGLVTTLPVRCGRPVDLPIAHSSRSARHRDVLLQRSQAGHLANLQRRTDLDEAVLGQRSAPVGVAGQHALGLQGLRIRPAREHDQVRRDGSSGQVCH